MNNLKSEIFQKVKEYFEQKSNEESKKIGVAYPCFDHKEVNQALDSLLDVWISQGPKVKQFEEEYAKYIGTKHGLACNSGSSANLLALSALIKTGKVKPGSEVIVPAATFTTVISPIIQNGLKPVFVDVEMDTYNIDPKSIENAINENTGLIMVVHSLGCSAKMEEIMKISEKHNIPVFEDCCEAHGSAINGKKVGSFGLISAFSFFVAHNMTTGEGGMITTNDDELAEKCRVVRNHGTTRNDGEYQGLDYGYTCAMPSSNYRMSEFHAVLGLAQNKYLQSFIERRNEIADIYNERLSKVEWLQTPFKDDTIKQTYWQYIVKITDGRDRTETLLRLLDEYQIPTANAYSPLCHEQEIYKGYLSSNGYKNSEEFITKIFSLPMYVEMTDEQVHYICRTIEEL
mgnify:CR=1 FL=1